MKCVNCGAELHGAKCDYCGSEYSGNSVVAEFGEDSPYGKLVIGKNEYDVYIGEIKYNHIVERGMPRDERGRIRPTKTIIKRQFVLSER